MNICELPTTKVAGFAEEPQALSTTPLLYRALRLTTLLFLNMLRAQPM